MRRILPDRSGLLAHQAPLVLAVALLLLGAGGCGPVPSDPAVPGVASGTTDRAAGAGPPSGAVASAEAARVPMPDAAIVQPRRLAAFGAFAGVGLLLLQYAHWRRRYILVWAAGWSGLGASLWLVSGTYADPLHARLAAGGFGALNLASAVLFLISADAYAGRPVLRRHHALLLGLLAGWFTLAPQVVRQDVVTVSAYLTLALVLLTAGVRFLRLAPVTRAAGAVLVGVALAGVGGSNLYIAATFPQFAEEAWLVLRLLVVNALLYGGAALGMHLLIFSDMTGAIRRSNRELEAAREELRRQATSDPLTGCYNRRYFDEIAGRELGRHRRYGQPLSILFIDVDQFKAVNDTLGHEAGDELLRQVAALLRARLRDVDYIFRWGGDEFVVLISCRRQEAIAKTLELKGAFADAPGLPGMAGAPGLSIGCVEVTPEAPDLQSAVAEADRLMYEEKAARDAAAPDALARSSP